MRVQVFQLFFKKVGDEALMPADGDLYAMAVKYVAENMKDEIDFTDYKHTWVACETDEDDKPVRALGVMCMVFRPDIPVMRFTDNVAAMKLIQRANDHLHDSYGLRGAEALVHIKESEDMMCPSHKEWMQAFGLKPANRWSAKVR